jgi:hypothetical protein
MAAKSVTNESNVLENKCRTNVDSTDVSIENQLSMTVVFPDSALPEKTNGGFENQEEFRAFVLEHQQNGKWDSEVHSRPSCMTMADYHGNTIVQAFPLLFPYGFSGFPDDPAVIELSKREGKKTHLSRKRLDVMRKLLQHRKPVFHGPMFNLMVSNLIMKETIFVSACIQANVKRSDGSALANSIANMTAAQLTKAILAARKNSSSQHSTATASRYLHTISATCRSLPHTNEASLEARKIYFSYLMKFGMPCVFLTVTPDDMQNFRIVAYSLKKTVPEWGRVDVNSLSNEEILANFKIRKSARSEYPGLCAEEYRRIMDMVIQHIFQWDDKNQNSTGIGAFGELLAWCLATEEQGRKTLHGHYLLFVKSWILFWKALQRQRNLSVMELSSSEAKQYSLKYFNSVCSANLFQDMETPCGVLVGQDIYHHENCKSERSRKRIRFNCDAMPDQTLRLMRHKEHCHHHKGLIATCTKCGIKISAEEIVTNALQKHLGDRFEFPDKTKHLDCLVYETQKNFNWYSESEIEQAKRYLASNALVNVHRVTHTARCFKRGSECYANLPEGECERSIVHFCKEFDVWTDYSGKCEQRYMFRFYPRRAIADAYMNCHNPLLTRLLGCNTNVLVGMNGVSVLYVTGYNVKSNQKEERVVYERISQTVVKVLEKRENSNIEREDTVSIHSPNICIILFNSSLILFRVYQEGALLPEYQNGLRTMLHGIYANTSAHITAAPMAHYLALHSSRFRYSHDYDFLPAHGIYQYLCNNDKGLYTNRPSRCPRKTETTRSFKGSA